MRIVASATEFNSSKIAVSTHSVSERLNMWNTSGAQVLQRDSKGDKTGATGSPLIDRVDLSQQALAAVANSPVQASGDSKKDPFDEEFVGDLKSRVIKNIVEAMTGKKIRTLSPKELQDTWKSDAPPADNRVGWGVDYEYHETAYTKEGVAFSATGSVTTADGRTIDFSASLEMSNERYEQIDVSLKAGDALIDPLMIDLTGSGAGLSDVKFSFDLDVDGREETVSAPKAGSGFLARDVNGNGIIDNGSELFGPQTGSGFAELAALDSDGSGWIDEGDSAFDKLSIWRKGDAGENIIESLQKSGIGALYTGKAATAYAMSNSNNQLNGMLRESGVYLRENGTAGFLQEVDLVA